MLGATQHQPIPKAAAQAVQLFGPPHGEQVQCYRSEEVRKRWNEDMDKEEMRF